MKQLKRELEYLIGENSISVDETSLEVYTRKRMWNRI